jgi:hypothetical protein
LNELFHDQRCHLRQDQGSETHDWLKQQRQSQRTTRLKRTGFAQLKTTAEMEILARAYQPPQVPDGKLGVLPSSGDGVGMPTIKADDDDDDDDSDEAEIVTSSRGVGISLALAPKKGRVKGRGRGGRGKGAAAPVAAAGGSHAGGGSGMPPASSSQPSTPSNRLLLPGTPQKLSSNVENYITSIDISGIMAGKNLGSEMYQAQRTINGLEKCGDEHNSDRVSLFGHLANAKKALQLKPDNIGKLSKVAREGMFKDLLLDIPNLMIPPVTQAALIAQYSKEMAITTDLTNIESFTQCINPRGVADKFDPLKPRLMDSSISPADTTKLLHRVLIDEFLLVSVMHGQSHHACMDKVCANLVNHMQVQDDVDDLPPSVSAFVKDIVSLFGIVRAVLSTLPVDGVPHGDVALFVLDDQNAKKLGKAKNIVKQAMKQNTYFKDRLQNWKDFEAKILLYGKPTQAAIILLSQDPDLEDLTDIVLNFALWYNNLPSTCKEDLCESLHNVLKRFHAVNVIKNQTSTTKELLAETAKLKTMLDTVAPVAGQGSDLSTLQALVETLFRQMHNLLQGTLVADALQQLIDDPSENTSANVVQTLGDSTTLKLADPSIIGRVFTTCIEHVLNIAKEEDAATQENQACLQIIDAVLRLTHSFRISDEDDGVKQARSIKLYLHVQRANLLFQVSGSAAATPLEAANVDGDLSSLIENFEKLKASLPLATPVAEVAGMGDEEEEGDEPDGENFGDDNDVNKAFGHILKLAKTLIQRGATAACKRDMNDVLQMKIHVDPLRFGAADGKSWKDELETDAGIQEVLVVAATTINGNDKTVAKSLTTAFNVLKQVQPLS